MNSGSVLGLQKVGWAEDRNVCIGLSCRSATKGSSSPHASRFREKGVECKQQPDQRNSYEQDVDPGHGWLLYAPLQRRAPTATKESRLLLGPRLPTGRPPVSSPGGFHVESIQVTKPPQNAFSALARSGQVSRLIFVDCSQSDSSNFRKCPSGSKIVLIPPCL